MAQPNLALRTTRNGLFSHYVVAGSKNPPPLGVGSVNIEIKDNRVLQARYKGNINCTAEDTKTIESYIASIKIPDKKNQAA